MKQILMLTVLAFVVAGQGANQAEVQLQAAIKAEVFDGNLKAAIERYQRIITTFSNDRPVVAKALIRMGQCYEKLGDAESRKAYERVVREFADQKEAVEEARALLAATTRDRPPDSGPAFERKWVLPPAAAGRSLSRHPSPDGRYMYFHTEDCMWQHDLTTGEDRRLIQGQLRHDPLVRLDVSVGTPEVSPDGKQIAYTRLTVKGKSQSYELWVVGIDGSGATLVMNDKERRLSPKGWFSPKGWSPDARYILIVVYSDMTAPLSVSLALVSVTDGSVRAIGAQDDFSFGSFSPDGKYLVAYSAPSREGQGVPVPGRVKLIPVDGSSEIPVFESSARAWSPLWTPDGRRILFKSDRSGTTDLWSLRMSGTRPEGEPELVKREVDSMGLLGFTRDGSLYYQTSTFQSDVFSADLDPATGRVISKPAQVNQRFVGSVGYPVEWSPDGQFLMYARTSGTGTRVTSLVVRSERTGEEREVVLAPAFSGRTFYRALWFPDGRSLLVSDYAKGRVLRQIDVQTGQVRTFLDLSESTSGPPELWSVSMDGGEPQPSGLAVPGLYEMAVHPDGNRIAFCKTSGPVEEVWAIKNLLSTPAAPRK